MTEELVSVEKAVQQEINEEQQNVEEIKKEIAPTLSNSTEEEKKEEILETGQIASIHKPVYRRYDFGD